MIYLTIYIVFWFLDQGIHMKCSAFKWCSWQPIPAHPRWAYWNPDKKVELASLGALKWYAEPCILAFALDQSGTIALNF